MASTDQINANRENSKLSTGPRTPEGKAASSQNSIKHGFNAADPVLAHEDRDEFNALLGRYLSEFAPTTAHEEWLVSQMAGARWKLDRLQRMENEMMDAALDPTLAFSDEPTAIGFARLERYRASLERTYHRSVRELRASQKFQNEPKIPPTTTTQSEPKTTEPDPQTTNNNSRTTNHELRPTNHEEPAEGTNREAGRCYDGNSARLPLKNS